MHYTGLHLHLFTAKHAFSEAGQYCSILFNIFLWSGLGMARRRDNIALILHYIYIFSWHNTLLVKRAMAQGSETASLEIWQAAGLIRFTAPVHHYTVEKYSWKIQLRNTIKKYSLEVQSHDVHCSRLHCTRKEPSQKSARKWALHSVLIVLYFETLHFKGTGVHMS